MGRMPAAVTNAETAETAPAEPPAMKTSSGCPDTSPTIRVLENVVLKTVTTSAGVRAEITSAAVEPGGTTSESSVSSLTGLEISTTTLGGLKRDDRV